MKRTITSKKSWVVMNSLRVNKKCVKYQRNKHWKISTSIIKISLMKSKKLGNLNKINFTQRSKLSSKSSNKSTLNSNNQSLMINWKFKMKLNNFNNLSKWSNQQFNFHKKNNFQENYPKKGKNLKPLNNLNFLKQSHMIKGYQLLKA